MTRVWILVQEVLTPCQWDATFLEGSRERMQSVKNVHGPVVPILVLYTYSI